MRREFRAIVKRLYKHYKGNGGYDALGLFLGISGGMAWNFCKTENYWPKDPKIQEHIKRKAAELGIIVSRRKRDLWSMSPEELLWRLINREEVHGNNQNTA